MNHFGKAVLLLHLIVVQVFCQEWAMCGAPNEKEPDGVKRTVRRWEERDLPLVGVLRHVIFANATEGVAAIDPRILEDLTDYTNYLYSSGPFRFVLDKIQFVENEEYYAMNDMFNQITKIASEYNKDNAFNVYWTTNLCGPGVCYCGYAYYPWSRNLRRTAMMHSWCLGAIFAHEIGHNLGLYHTHDTARGHEKVDGSNCDVTGDLVCDTPADPMLKSDNVDSFTCGYTGNSTDSDNNKHQPDTFNVMSYTIDHCRENFTQGQWERALSYYNEIRSAFIELTVLTHLDESGDVIVEANSSHEAEMWHVLVNGQSNGVFTMTHNISKVLQLEASSHRIQVEACYPYTNPQDGTQYCTNRSLFITVPAKETVDSSPNGDAVPSTEEEHSATTGTEYNEKGCN